MNKFQTLIISQNQRSLNIVSQRLILHGQFVISILWLSIIIKLQGNNTNDQFKFDTFYYWSLPTFLDYMNIHSIAIQIITAIFSLLILLLVLFGGNQKQCKQIIFFFWNSYPHLLQLIIIQNSAYSLLRDSLNFAFSIINILIAVITSQITSIYTFQQSDSQILTRTLFHRITIPLIQSLISLFSGLSISKYYYCFIYLIVQGIFDIYFGLIYLLRFDKQYIKLDTNRIAIRYSLIRLILIVFLFYYQGNGILYFGLLIVPLIITIQNNLYDRQFISFIYKTNMFFQLICINKYKEKDDIILNIFLCYQEIEYYKIPFNRVFMLSMFCSHMNFCDNLKCFCKNKKCYENISVTSQQQLQLDLKEILQKLNYIIGEKEIQYCYYQLLLLFLENYIKNSSYSSILDQLIQIQGFFECQFFHDRLFLTKLRYQHLKIHYPQLHPNFIALQSTQQLISQRLFQYIGDNMKNFNVETVLYYFRLFDQVQNEFYNVVKEKLKLFTFFQQNYSNPLPYVLDQKSHIYIKNVNQLEKQIKILQKMNGLSASVKQIIIDFYSLLKIDTNRYHKQYKSEISFINNNETCFVICHYNVDLKIVEYSSNFQNFTNHNLELRGMDVETIIPIPLKSWHRLAVQEMIATGKTKLVNKSEYQLIMQVNNYIIEINALLRYDNSNYQQTRFIGFIQQRDQDQLLLLANERGQIVSYSQSIMKVFQLDKISLLNVNYFQLSPNLLQQQSELDFDFDGFILLPLKIEYSDLISTCKSCLKNPDKCLIFLVNGEHYKKQYTKTCIYYLKILSYYQVKELDFKLLALDIIIRQIMVKQLMNKNSYQIPIISARRIEIAKKSLKVNQHTPQDSLQDSLDDSYNLVQDDDSERNVQFKQQQSPEFMQSLDSIRTQQGKLIPSLDQTEQMKDDFCPYSTKDQLIEIKQDSNQEINTKLNQSKENEIKIDYENTHQIIQIEIDENENQNIDEHFQIILANVKKRKANKEILEVKNPQKSMWKKSSTWHSNNQNNQKQIISNIIQQFLKSKLNKLSYLEILSILILIINISFIIGYIINSIVQLEGVQMDSNNQTYPLILYNDLNLVILGICVDNYYDNQYTLIKQFIILGSEQYQNQSIYVNDEENDYHDFLKALDEETILVNEIGIQIEYKKRYFFKNFIITILREIEEQQTYNLKGEKEIFLFNNYNEITSQLWNLKASTTEDVISRILQMDQLSYTLLILSIVLNSLGILSYLIMINSIYQWKTKIYKTFFLFPVSQIQDVITAILQIFIIQTDYKEKIENTTNEKLNKSQYHCWNIKIILLFIILMLLSLGFYIPLFLYIDYINNYTININDVLTEISKFNLKQSTLILWNALNLTQSENSIILISNTSTFNQVDDECEQSELFVLYNLPFDSTYDQYPEIQQYAYTSICDNCTILDNQLQQGQGAFEQYLDQHLYDVDKLLEIYQAFQLVIEYGQTTNNKFFSYMQIRLQNNLDTLYLILELGILMIILVEGIILFYVLKNFRDLEIQVKNMIRLFPINLVYNNKYLLQMLIKFSIS